MSNLERKCRFFEGDKINIAPLNNNEAKKLIGKDVKYLRNSDIDKTGRGYFFLNLAKLWLSQVEISQWMMLIIMFFILVIWLR